MLEALFARCFTSFQTLIQICIAKNWSIIDKNDRRNSRVTLRQKETKREKEREKRKKREKRLEKGRKGEKKEKKDVQGQ